jgi:transposase
LEEWVSGRNTPQKLVWRARLVLLSADRSGVRAITRAVGKSKVTLARWQERYLAKGIAGLRRDATRAGRKPPLSAETIQQVVHQTLHEKRRWCTDTPDIEQIQRLTVNSDF